MKKISGVYLIRNVVTGKVYVGGSTHVRERFNQHRKTLVGQRHKNPELQKDWNIFGKLNFEFIVHEKCTLEKIFIREAYWIKMLGTLNPELGYNYFIPDNSVPPRERKIKKPKVPVRHVCINAFGESFVLTYKEIFERLGFKRHAVCLTGSYWRGCLKATKTYKGWVFVNTDDYKEGFDYLGFDKLKYGRLPVIKRQPKKNVKIEVERRGIKRVPIKMWHSETGEEKIYPSISKALEDNNMILNKVQKCLKHPGQNKHRGYYFKRI